MESWTPENFHVHEEMAPQTGPISGSRLSAASISRSRPFPDPIMIPSKRYHRQSIIILHGRGSTALRFGTQGCPDKAGIYRAPFLTTPTSSSETLQVAFPHAKIIFPSASRSHATIYEEKLIHQWFDNWHLEDRRVKEDLMIEGLSKSVEFIHALLRKEIESVGAPNVVLWGLSQGCATSLTALLTWDGEAFGAVVGICGWLPFDSLLGTAVEDKPGNVTTKAGANSVDQITAILESTNNSEQAVAQKPPSVCGHCNTAFSSRSQLFKHLKICDKIPECHYCEEKFPSKDLLIEHLEVRCPSYDPALPPRGVTFLRRKLDMRDKNGMVFQNIPVFLGHGTKDDRVDIKLGQEAMRCLESVGCDVRMREYEGLGHWTSPEMMSDIFAFLKEKLGDGAFSKDEPAAE